MKILANDGLNKAGIDLLTDNGFEVITDKIPQEKLTDYINTHHIKILLVRSATKVRQDIIDQCPSLQTIGRGGVGMDNIDVDYARSKGIRVINTPAASSASVAELVFAHLFSGARFLEDANRKMPIEGKTKFETLKKKYAKGIELRGKTIAIVGLGRIGQEVAKIAFGLGMNVIAVDQLVNHCTIPIDFPSGQTIELELRMQSLEEALSQADFVSLHVPAQKDGALIGKQEFDLMKTGAAIINCARGGVIDEDALVEALDAGKLSFAGIDVFSNEPQPSEKLLQHEKISLSPHIGASTDEAQERIGISLAEQICQIHALAEK